MAWTLLRSLSLVAQRQFTRGSMLGDWMFDNARPNIRETRAGDWSRYEASAVVLYARTRSRPGRPWPILCYCAVYCFLVPLVAPPSSSSWVRLKPLDPGAGGTLHLQPGVQMAYARMASTPASKHPQGWGFSRARAEGPEGAIFSDPVPIRGGDSTTPDSAERRKPPLDVRLSAASGQGVPQSGREICTSDGFVGARGTR